jgi:hypothetical protein
MLLARRVQGPVAVPKQYLTANQGEVFLSVALKSGLILRCLEISRQAPRAISELPQ